jgi:two-component system, sensor histidine kinase and response regulator
MQNTFAPTRLLIIDDAPDSIAAAAAVLRTSDYELHAAVNAHAALQLIKEEPPDLILLDVHLPDMDGFKLCSIIRQNSDYATIPIIFLTASNDEESIRLAFQLGARDYVTKPFKKAELLARVNTQIRLRYQQHELQKAYQELDNFSGAVAHDLKAPLLTLAQLADILKNDYEKQLDDNGSNLITAIQDKAAETIAITEHLLEFSRASKASLNCVQIDMEELTRTIFKELYATCPERSIELRIKPLPSVYGDLLMLKQLLRNILSNAIKYTQHKTKAIIEFTCSTTNNEYIFCCQDNGAGFDMRQASHLFHVFERLHSAREFPGNGMGLAICQRIIQRHGGRISLTGIPQCGAACSFTLPRCKDYK